MQTQAWLEHLGEGATLLHLGEQLDPTLVLRVQQLDQRLRQARWPELLETLPCYASLMLRHRIEPSARKAWFARLLDFVQHSEACPTTSTGQLHEIPVYYGGQQGPDLAALAQHCKLSPEQVIERHQACEYLVAMTGFAPGFPYLSGLDPSLAMPRKARPLLQVPAGSVAIGGLQTGIYPACLPGGWHIIGQTPLSLFNPNQPQQLCLLQPGDRVRFIAVQHANS